MKFQITHLVWGAAFVLASVAVFLFFYRLTTPIILECGGVARGAEVADPGKVKPVLYKLFVSQAGGNGGLIDWKTWDADQEEWLGYSRLEASKTKYVHGELRFGDYFLIDRISGAYYELRTRPFQVGDRAEWLTDRYGDKETVLKEVRGKCVPASEPRRTIEQIF